MIVKRRSSKIFITKVSAANCNWHFVQVPHRGRICLSPWSASVAPNLVGAQDSCAPNATDRNFSNTRGFFRSRES
jgi:hypothetical protein